MGFVEAITSKVLQQGKDFFPQLTADLVLPCRAGKELFLHAVKELCLLFPMARRRISASPKLKPPSTETICMTCS